MRPSARRALFGSSRRSAAPVLLLVALAALLLAPSAAGAPGAPAPHVPASATPVTGYISGPNALAVNAVQFYKLNGTGGPAVAANGSLVGNITFWISVVAANLTGVSVSPTTGPLGYVNSSVTLDVGNVTEAVTLNVMIASLYNGQNESINLSRVVQVVEPYVLSATVVAGPQTVLGFPIAIYLNGAYVGTVAVPTLTANSTYDLSFKYATLPLGQGTYTFTMIIPNSEQGLLSFANGRSSYSTTFTVPGPAPNYTLWGVAGVGAFVGVGFISLVLVGNRRRGRGRS